jgi:hypothetical protein
MMSRHADEQYYHHQTADHRVFLLPNDKMIHSQKLECSEILPKPNVSMSIHSETDNTGYTGKAKYHECKGHW